MGCVCGILIVKWEMGGENPEVSEMPEMPEMPEGGRGRERAGEDGNGRERRGLGFVTE